jgi:predicted ATPase
MLDELDVIEVLPRIIDKSLIAVDPSHAEVRYRLLETLRLYASDRWQPTGEKPVVEARHAMYFLELAEEGTANLRISKHEEWMDRLKAEHDNLRQALRWSLDNAEIETGMRLAGALYRFWLYNDNIPRVRGGSKPSSLVQTSFMTRYAPKRYSATGHFPAAFPESTAPELAH